MNQGPVMMGGLVFRFREYHFRVWKYGFEYGNKLGGRVIFFPWAKRGKDGILF